MTLLRGCLLLLLLLLGVIATSRTTPLFRQRLRLVKGELRQVLALHVHASHRLPKLAVFDVLATRGGAVEIWLLHGLAAYGLISLNTATEREIKARTEFGQLELRYPSARLLEGDGVVPQQDLIAVRCAQNHATQTSEIELLQRLATEEI